MNQRQMELEQLFLDEEKLTLKKLKENYADALDDIDEKIAILQGRQDADMQNVIYQIEYQKALKGQVSAILEQMNVNNFETVSEYLEKSYEQGFLGTLYDLQGQGIPLIMPIDQKQAVIAIRHESKLSEDLYTALGKDTKVLSKQIASEITRGISSALPYKEISRNVAAKAGISQNNAMRIARTESHRIQNKAISDCQWKAKEKGADIVKIWSAALDGNTRPHHRQLDGQIRELEEPFEIAGMKVMEPGGFGDPAEDINCRCRCNSKARWLLDAEQTKHLGNTDNMTDEQLQPIADKLGIDVDELRKYSDQIIPVNAKNYDDFRRQYEKLVNHDNVERVRSNVQKMNTLEKSGKSTYNSGALNGAYNNSNDPKGKKRNEHAEKYYESIKNSKKGNVVEAISKNANVDAESVSKMYDHLFVNEYDFGNGKQSFDPDYYMAESIRRLREGKNIQEHDLILIGHESTEYDLMKTGMGYEEAHAIANEKYNYGEALDKWLDENE